MLSMAPIIVLSACSPSSMTGLANGLNSLANSSRSTSLQCSGKTYGTFTSASATLSLNILSNGEAAGTFTNNGTIFQAKGVVPGHTSGDTYFIDSVNLQLDSRTGGGAVGIVGVKPIGLAGAVGSTGNLFGTIDNLGVMTGTFKGIQGNYRLNLACSG